MGLYDGFHGAEDITNGSNSPMITTSDGSPTEDRASIGVPGLPGIEGPRVSDTPYVPDWYYNKGAGGGFTNGIGDGDIGGKTPGTPTDGSMYGYGLPGGAGGGTPGGFTPDKQNPWFTGSNAPSGAPPPGTTPNTGAPINPGAIPNPKVGAEMPGFPGSKVVSEGPDWLWKLNNQNTDMTQWLDASKWQSWTDDDWRAATGGYGNNSPLFGELAKYMTPEQINNYSNHYGVGGAGYAPGTFDFTTGKFTPDPAAAGAGVNGLTPANNGPLTGTVGTAAVDGDGKNLFGAYWKKTADGTPDYAAMASTEFYNSLTPELKIAYNKNNMGWKFAELQVAKDVQPILGSYYKGLPDGTPDYKTMNSMEYYNSLPDEVKIAYVNNKLGKLFTARLQGKDPAKTGSPAPTGNGGNPNTGPGTKVTPNVINKNPDGSHGTTLGPTTASGLTIEQTKEQELANKARLEALRRQNALQAKGMTGIRGVTPLPSGRFN